MPATEPDYDAAPPFARIGEIAVPLTLVVAVGIQRDVLLPPGWSLLLAIAAALPFVLEGVGVPVPRLLSTAIVLGAVLVLVSDPVNADLAPFFLVYLAGHDSLVASRWGSIVAMLGARRTPARGYSFESGWRLGRVRVLDM